MSPVITRIEITRPAPHDVRITWTVAGDPVAVDLAHGPSPHAIDHAHVATVAAGTTTHDLAGVGAGPVFVSLTAHGHAVARVAGERLVPFEGLQNFRDLGGYEAEGGQVRWGRLFRADSMHKLTAADLDSVARLGLRAVFDLRGDRERETHPNPLDNVQLPVTGRAPTDESDDVVRERERAAFVESGDGERVLRDLYVGMLVHSAPLFTRFFRGVLEPHGTPALFHCHAGKDRTGVVAALVLLAIGVTEEDVLDDYVLTQRYRTLENQQDSFANMLEMGMSPEAAAGVLSTPRWAMADMLASLRDDHGGIERYLTGPVGLTAADLDRLHELLVG